MKEFTTNTETLRIETEELVKPGKSVNPVQIWRDAPLIPDVAPSEDNITFVDMHTNDGDYQAATVLSARLNGYNQPIICHYKNVPLYKVPGTVGCYSNGNLLKDIIGPHFGKDYLYKLLLDNVEVPFGIGNPEFDVEMGILKFQDDKYSRAIVGRELTISYYKYVGRKGLADMESLPFADNLYHFKNTDDPSKTASFLVKGDGHQNYILPYGNTAIDKEGAENTNVLVSQENISNVLYMYGTIDGGTW